MNEATRTWKKKYDDTQLEVDEMKRKIGLSKENGRLEAQVQIDAMNDRIRELESQIEVQVTEIRKVCVSMHTVVK